MKAQHRAVALAVLVLLLAQCSLGSVAVRDEVLESGVTALQTRFDAFFTMLSAGAPASAFATHPSFYADMRSEIAALELRAAGQPGNTHTLGALEALEQNLARLETAHRDGISAAEVPVLRELFAAQFRTLLQLERSKRVRKES